MKKLLVLLLTVTMFIFLTGCGKDTSTPVLNPDEHAASLGLNNLELPALSEDDKKYTINLGYYDCDHMTAACVGESTGIFQALGINVSLTGNGRVPEAASAGHMDAGYISARTAMTAIYKGAPIFIAAHNHIGGSYYLVAANNIETPQNLVGKKLGTGSEPEKKSPNWVQFTQNLNIPTGSSNYEVFDMATDRDKYFALKAGQLDGYMCCDPWASMAEFEGTGKIMDTSFSITTEKLNEGSIGTCCAFVLSNKFAEEHQALAERLIFAHTKSIEYMYTHPYKASMIFAEYYKVPEEVGLMTIYKKLIQEGRTIRWDINNENLKNMVDFYEDYNVYYDFATPEDSLNTQLLAQCGAKDFDDFIVKEVDPVFPVGMSYADFLAKAKEIDNV